MNPYSTPKVIGKDEAPSKLQQAEREQFVADALVILGSGKGHTAIINHLRGNGMHYEDAKRESYAIFDEAKRQLRRKQIPHRMVAWFFILLGILLPICMLLFSDYFSVLAGAPVLLGVGILYKLPNPSRLPKPTV